MVLKNGVALSPWVARCVRLLAESSGLIPPFNLLEDFKKSSRIRNTRNPICIAGVVAMGLALSGGEKQCHKREERYVLGTANVNLPYWQEAQAGLTDIGKTAGVKVEMVGPATLSPSEELSEFQKVVAQNPAGIMVSASDPALFKESINKAVLQGIPVICMDSDSPESRRVLFIGTDNFRAGQKSAKRMVDLLGGQGRIVLIGLPGQFNTEERVRGVNEVLKSYRGIKIVETIHDHGDQRAGYEGISELLRKKKEKIDGIICFGESGG